MKNQVVRAAAGVLRSVCHSSALRRHRTSGQSLFRPFHSSIRQNAVKPYLLADIGEGITECQIIQWYVQPGARVEQFDPICEVQSDKAVTEITSRFDGVIKKLYYEADDMAKVGKPLVDIDIQGDISPADEVLTKLSGEQPEESPAQQRQEQPSTAQPQPPSPPSSEPSTREVVPNKPVPERLATLATPAVRHLCKEHDLNIVDIPGTGKDGRVLKEDVLKYAAAQKATAPLLAVSSTRQNEDRIIPLSPIQNQMFKTMTRSLSIPHFLYTDSVDFTSLDRLRQRLKLSPLPFVIKAVSLALQSYPLLNAHLDTTTNLGKPNIILKAQHNFGIAVDSPSGLLVPVVRNVQDYTIQSLAEEINRLVGLARDGKLTAADLTGTTFTISNIGSIGGRAVSPVVVAPQVGILGIGRATKVPAFNDQDELVCRKECVFSWSADHRVIDGAMTARCAETVKVYLENPEDMLVRLR